MESGCFDDFLFFRSNDMSHHSSSMDFEKSSADKSVLTLLTWWPGLLLHRVQVAYRLYCTVSTICKFYICKLTLIYNYIHIFGYLLSDKVQALSISSKVLSTRNGLVVRIR